MRCSRALEEDLGEEAWVRVESVIALIVDIESLISLEYHASPRSVPDAVLPWRDYRRW